MPGRRASAATAITGRNKFIYLQYADVDGQLNHPLIYILDRKKGITISP
jgi:hypothetical protein